MFLHRDNRGQSVSWRWLKNKEEEEKAIMGSRDFEVDADEAKFS